MSDWTPWASAGAVLCAAVAVVTMLVEAAPDPVPATLVAAQPGTTLLDGASLFLAKGCASCHTGPDSTSPHGLPDLRDASTWAATRQPGQSAEQYLAESMRSPGAFISPEFDGPQGPTSGMPTLALSEAEIDVLVAYLLGE